MQRFNAHVQLVPAGIATVRSFGMVFIPFVEFWHPSPDGFKGDFRLVKFYTMILLRKAQNALISVKEFEIRYFQHKTFTAVGFSAFQRSRYVTATAIAAHSSLAKP